MDRTRALWLVGVALLAATASGCARPATTPGSGGSVTSTPSPRLSMPGTGKPVGSGPEITVSGVMRAGAEGRCLVLDTPGGDQYQLLNADPSVVVEGARLTVTGRVAHGVSTTCMQGKPFTVSQVVSATGR